MLIEILLVFIAITPYLFLFMFFKYFRCIINVIMDIENMFDLMEAIPNETVDVVDTPAEAFEQTNNRQKLIDLINQGKAHLLPGKTPWTIKRISKTPETVIKKIYNDYEEREIRQKAVKTGQALGTHITNLYSNGVSKVLNIDSVENLRKDIENDPIIKDSMADIGALMVGTFGRLLAPMLVACHTANHAVMSKKLDVMKQIDEVINEVNCDKINESRD